MFLPSDRYDRNPAASIALRLTTAGLALATANGGPMSLVRRIMADLTVARRTVAEAF